MTRDPFSLGIPDDIAAARFSTPAWEPSFYWGLLRPSLCSALRGGIAYAWGLRMNHPGPEIEWMLTPQDHLVSGSGARENECLHAGLFQPGNTLCQLRQLRWVVLLLQVATSTRRSMRSAARSSASRGSAACPRRATAGSAGMRGSSSRARWITVVAAPLKIRFSDRLKLRFSPRVCCTGTRTQLPSVARAQSASAAHDDRHARVGPEATLAREPIGRHHDR